MADIDMIDPNESAIKVMDSALDSNATINMTADDIREMLKQFLNHPDYLYDKWVRNLIIICFYCTIVIISLFGNLMVCYVIFKKRRMRTETNLLMANLTVSDIVMTAINIPFNVTRILMDDWLFGHTLCILLPLIQVTSVYVSTFSMTVIAIDRYQAIINPLHRRLSTSVPIIVIIAIIWLTALIFSIPNVAFNEVVVMKVHRELYRCRAVFPNHRTFYRQVITMFTFLTQYVVPLSITAFAYIIISFNIWFKLLSTDTDQQKTRERSRRRTIKMLAIVVLVFAICWLPLNIHHIYSDFINTNVTDINWFLVCHWFAMSSVCYNPWIYFCLNKHFRQEIKNIVRCTGMWCWNGSFIEVSSSSSSQRANKPNLQRTNALRLITTNGVLKQSDAMVINDNNSMIVNNNKVSQLMIEESII